MFSGTSAEEFQLSNKSSNAVLFYIYRICAFKLFRINYVGTTYRFWTPVYLGIVAYE